MKLIFNDDQKLLFETVQKFAADHGSPDDIRRYRDNRELPGYEPKRWQQLAALGFTGLNVPEAHGGSELGFRETCLLLEACGAQLVPEPLLSTVVIATQALLLGGNDDQQARWLPTIADGSAIIGFAYGERAGRYDRRYHSLTASREGNGFVLSGSKQDVLDGNIAAHLVVAARTSGDVRDPNGITLFIVDANAEGIAHQRLHTIDGRNMAHIEFDNVTVPTDAVLGEVDGGFKLLDALLDRATIALAAEMLGAAQRAFDITLAYLKERVQFDVPIGSFQALQHRAAQMFTQLELSRSAVMGAAATVDENPNEIDRFASLAKAKMSATMDLIAAEGVQMHGGVGVTDEYDIGLYLKRARAADALFGDAGWHKTRWASLGGY